jgi:hypothetical protein
VKRLSDRYRLLIRLLLVSLYLIASIGSEAHRAWHEHFAIATTSLHSDTSGTSSHSLSNDSGHTTSAEALGSSCLICAHSMGIPLVPVVLTEAIVAVRQPLLPLHETGILTSTVSLLPGLRAPPFCS